MVSVPKEKNKRVCSKEDFRGVSLVAVVYKAMCLIVQERLIKVVKERELLAKEQGGVRRGRRCRDQILSLALLDNKKEERDVGCIY